MQSDFFRCAGKFLKILFLSFLASTYNFSQERLAHTDPEITSRGAHEQRWQNLTTFLADDGSEQIVTNSYVELATGLNYFDKELQQWLPSNPHIEILDGKGVIRHAQHQAIFAANANDPNGSIDLS